MNDLRAVLFDAGGTLIHVDGERVCRALDVAFDPRGFRLAEAAAVAKVRALILERPESRDAERVPLYFDTLLAGLGLPEGDARRQAAGAVVAEHRRLNLWSRPSDDAVDTLAELKRRGYRLAVVSNADGRVRALLEGAGLSGYLEFVIDSAEAGLEKPDPRIFHAATGRLDLPPSACAYVGDIYEIDVVGAERAGLHPILIGEGPAPEGVRRVPDLNTLLSLFAGFA